MKPEVASRRIESFGQRFGEAHLFFAYHAAFPLALTPDLLYQVWANFQRDIHRQELKIPWLAVADLLLSTLCDEVGHELYEMDAAVRNALLRDLKENPRFGEKRINELSDFLLTYVQQQIESHDPDIRDFAQAQRWTALAYTRPSEAAHELALTLSKLKLTEKAEWVRMTSLVETFVEPMADFQPLFFYSRGMRNFARGNLEGASAEFSNISSRDDYQVYVAGVKLPIPEQIFSKTSRPIDSPFIERQNNEPSIEQQYIEWKYTGSKLVVLKFGEGSFEQGFAVTLQIGEEHDRPSTEIMGKLPPFPEMPLYYSHWQSSYRQLGNRYRLHADKVQVTNVSMIQDCENTAQILRGRFNTWLRGEDFRSLREKWLERLSPTEQIRVILQTENSQLQLLPWHLWDLLERYPKAEIALSSPTYDRIDKVSTRNQLVNILAIVGNSQGIDIQADRAFLQKVSNANINFLVEPQRKELTEYLWGQNWDILFFAGHSSSQSNGESGRIYLNKTDSLTISELKYALKKAIENGLQLAIFNSSDGFGLARELANLQIPQIIVMREPLPDQVAYEFLKYFLEKFASGESLYQAVRQARERLQGFEDRFPCATWLPVICQNPAQIPPTWKELRKVNMDITTSTSNWIQRLLRRWR